MQTPANIQTGAYFHRRAGTPTHKHTWTHRQAYYGGWVQTDCVECGSTPSVYFEGLWANSRFPGSSSAPPIEPAWGVCDGAERSYLGSIIKHTESIYQVVWWDILKFLSLAFHFIIRPTHWVLVGVSQKGPSCCMHLRWPLGVSLPPDGTVRESAVHRLFRNVCAGMHWSMGVYLCFLLVIRMHDVLQWCNRTVEQSQFTLKWWFPHVLLKNSRW